MPTMLEDRIARALELLGNEFRSRHRAVVPTIEERILAQALEDVERAEQRLREIQELMGDAATASTE